MYDQNMDQAQKVSEISLIRMNWREREREGRAQGRGGGGQESSCPVSNERNVTDNSSQKAGVAHYTALSSYLDAIKRGAGKHMHSWLAPAIKQLLRVHDLWVSDVLNRMSLHGCPKACLCCRAGPCPSGHLHNLPHPRPGSSCSWQLPSAPVSSPADPAASQPMGICPVHNVWPRPAQNYGNCVGI